MIHTANYLVEWKASGSWVDITEYVVSVSGNFETSGSGNGVAFGDSSLARASIEINPYATTPTLDVSTWAYVPVRATFTVDAHTAKGVAGIILEMDQDEGPITFSVVGFQQPISTTRVYSPLFERRPIATKTTALSVEDPSNGSYAAGPLNWILWQAGGRPYEQAGSYPTATFYYSLAQAQIAPPYSWVAGEDAWAEALRLVRAAGGQLYQRPDGVIAYVSPLSIAGGASQFTYTEDDYTTATRRGTARDVISSVNCTYIPRFLAGMMDVVSDTTQRLVPIGGTVTIELEPQYPLPVGGLETASGGTQLLADSISAVAFDGTQVEQGSSGYTHTLSVAAQHITITITNTLSQPFVIEKIVLRGTPIIPGEAGTVTLGSGAPAQTIEQSPYIQTRSHALRLCRMALAFYGTARPVITLSGVPYDPALQVGMAGTLTVPKWSLTAASVVILGITHSDTGLESDLDVVATAGLPALADYFLISTSAQAATKKIGY